MIQEMIKLRQMLDAEGIKWHDKSDKERNLYSIDRTHFDYRGYSFSAIHGYATYGGYSSWTGKDDEKIELMTNAYNDGNPVGWLSAEEVMRIVKGETE